ncbi:hypothetical protein Tco_1137120, partial [Tanacetum coccineum]
MTSSSSPPLRNHAVTTLTTATHMVRLFMGLSNPYGAFVYGFKQHKKGAFDLPGSRGVH